MEKYWARLSPEEKCMRLDKEALYSLVVQPVALRTAAITPGQHVVDAFCGAGGSAIGFALAGKSVTAIEMNPERLEMARYNANLFGVSDRITFIEGDSLEILPTLDLSTVFLAPPWGGPEYTQRQLFTLDAFSPNGHGLLNLALKC
jgi:trimethylguanosine synthase